MAIGSVSTGSVTLPKKATSIEAPPAPAATVAELPVVASPSDFAAAALASTTALTGTSATTTAAPVGNLGWNATGDSEGTFAFVLETLGRDEFSMAMWAVEDLGAAPPPEVAEKLTARIDALLKDPALARQITQTLIAGALGKLDLPKSKELLTRFDARSHDLSVSVEAQIALMKNETLALKADALGIHFFEPGTFKQLKDSEMGYGDLFHSPVTSPEIAAAENVLTALTVRRNALGELRGAVSGLYSQLR